MNASRKIFLRVLMSYLSVLVIPVVAEIWIYSSGLSSATDLFKKDTSNLIKATIVTSDVRFTELEHIPYYLKTDSNLYELLHIDQMEKNGADIYSVYQAYSNMTNFRLLNSAVEDVQIISLKNNFVIGNKSALRIDDLTYDPLIGFQEFDCASFETYIHENYFFNHMTLFHNQNGEAVPVLLYSFGYDDTSEPLAVIMIRLKKSYLQDTLAAMLSGQNGLAFIISSDNEMITSSVDRNCPLSLEEATAYIQNNPEDSKYRDYITNVFQSDYNGWKYCIFLPYQIIRQKMSSTFMRLLSFLLISLALSAGLTYMLVRRKAESLQWVIRYINGNEEYTSNHIRNEYFYVADSAQKLISNNQALEIRLQEQKPLLDAAVLRNLLDGVSYKSEELRYLFQILDIQPSHQLFAVMLLSTRVSEANDDLEYQKHPLLVSALVQEHIQKHTFLPVFPVDIDGENKALIFIGDGISKENFFNRIASFSEYVVRDAFEQNALRITCYLSDLFDMVDGIPTAYHQAVIISRQAVLREDCFLYLNSDIPPVRRFYYYPMQTERELIQLVRHGTKTELDTMIDSLRKANFIDRSLSASTVTQLTLSISNSILRDLSYPSDETIPLELKNRIANAKEFEELMDAVSFLNHYFMQANTQMQSSKLGRQFQDILQYINDNYTDPDLSITQLCERFAISESALYKLSKQMIGTSFPSLIEHMRIEQACKMLNEKKYLVKDISLAVGYINDNSFRRAFKRVMGMTPGEYAENCRNRESPNG